MAKTLVAYFSASGVTAKVVTNLPMLSVPISMRSDLQFRTSRLT